MENNQKVCLKSAHELMNQMDPSTCNIKLHTKLDYTSTRPLKAWDSIGSNWSIWLKAVPNSQWRAGP